MSLIVLQGCAGGEVDLPVLGDVRDSLGVTIVEYPTDVLVLADFRLEEVMRVGSLDGPQEMLFGEIVGGRLLGDSLVAVADRQTGRIQVFDLEGRHRRSSGRLGDGPGESRFLLGMGQCRFSGFTAFDIGWEMIHFDPSGEFIEESRIALEGAPPYHLACSIDSRFAAINWNLARSGPTLGVFTDSGDVRVLDDRGTELFSLGRRIGSVRWGVATGSQPHPAGRAAAFAFDGSELLMTDGEFFGFESYSESGRLSKVVRVDTPRPDQDSLLLALGDHVAARIDDPDRQANVRRFYAEMEPVADPSRVSAILARDGHVFLQELAPENMPGRWFEFDREGTPVGWLPLAPAARLLDVEGELLLTRETSELGVQQVVVYRRISKQ